MDTLVMVRYWKVFVVPFQFFPVRHGDSWLVDKRKKRGGEGLFYVSSDSSHRFRLF
jgi:hypothetical protein